MKIVRVKYKTPKGIEVENTFVKDAFGFKPIFIEDTYLDKKNKIISEEELDKV